MIRGAIEVAHRARVVGWIYSGSEALKGKTVLAFVGDRCVGAGAVDGFRQDLLDAKLGDGFCGFDFPVRLAADESASSLIVRLQYSDAALLQPASRVVGIETVDKTASGPDLGAVLPDHLSWLMDHRMLEQTEYDFLKAIHCIGAYERSLSVGKRGMPDLDQQRVEPEIVVQSLLGLLMLTEMRVARASLLSVSDYAVQSDSGAPVIALWSRARGRISVEERSHLAGRRARPSVLTEPPPGGIDYGFGPDTVLFLHRDCAFAPRGPAPASGIVLFTASPAAAKTRTIRAA